MAQQTIGVGSSANDGTGDPLRTAFNKINANFSELYGDTAEANDILDDTSPQLGGNLDINGFNITSARSNENIRIIPNGTGTVELEANTNVTGNLTATGNIFANGNINLGDGAGDQTKVTGVFEADQLQIDGTTLTSTVTNGSVTIQGNATGGVNVADITINDNKISASNSNSDLELSASGTGNVVVGAVTVSGTTLSAADSSQITIAEALQVNGAASLGTSLALATGATVTGILDEDAMGTNSATQLATQQSIKAYADTKAVLTGSTNNTITTVTGAHAVQGEANLTFDGSTLAVTGAATVSTTLGVTGASTLDGVTVTDNTISSNDSNANLEINANGTGTVNLENLKIGTSGSTVTTILDEDNLASDSATALATQQSIKAYVDTQIATEDTIAELNDTTITGTPADNEVLAYDSSSSKWINQTPAEASLVSLTGSETLTNKTLASPTFTTNFTIGSATITEAELEILDGANVTTAELNIMDGDTGASSVTLADADRLVVNDNGTMKQVAVTDMTTYIGDPIAMAIALG